MLGFRLAMELGCALGPLGRSQTLLGQKLPSPAFRRAVSLCAAWPLGTEKYADEPVFESTGSANRARHAQTSHANRQSARVLTLQQSTSPTLPVVRPIWHQFCPR